MARISSGDGPACVVGFPCGLLLQPASRHTNDSRMIPDTILDRYIATPSVFGLPSPDMVGHTRQTDPRRSATMPSAVEGYSVVLSPSPSPPVDAAGFSVPLQDRP